MTDAPTMHHLLWPVPDLQSALAFYVTGLGMALGFRDGDRFASVQAGGVTLALVAGKEDITGGVPAPAYKVADLGSAVAAAQAAGDGSTPDIVQPWPISITARSPRPQPTSSPRPGGRSLSAASGADRNSLHP